MIGLGIDIGTTTVCGVVMDSETGEVLEALTLANDSQLETKDDWESRQDVIRISHLCLKIKKHFTGKYPELKTIGISGQMHGMLYVDKEGNAVSSLYSWQDGRGDLPYKSGQTYCAYMSEMTGCAMATGFGLTTHFYNYVNNLVPPEAAGICTIGDYLAMRLTGRKKPLLHKSMAASLGLFDLANGTFNQKALEMLGLDSPLIPAVSETEKPIGEDEAGRLVSLALGDNQASFLGSVPQDSNMLLNIGTGSQISIFADKFDSDCSVELRPYLGDTWLMVGSPLCGGASYAYLKHFFEATLAMFGVNYSGSVYEVMNEAAQRAYDHSSELMIETKFRGTRTNPGLRGAIKDIDLHNLTPENLSIGMIRGICRELFDIYNQVPDRDQQSELMIGSGNGVRENKVMQRVIEDMFGKKLRIPMTKEEAACGGALYAMYAAGYYQSLEEVRAVIRTQGRIE